ncbi:MAG: SCO family protein [Beijerinckiaceae bacterium]|nr:SCO family protein [Beijerinckiaceae bacterium]
MPFRARHLAVGASRRTILAFLAQAVASLPFCAPARAQTDPLIVRPKFSLRSHRGERMSEAHLQGAPSLVFFGFTSCPDICPTTLLDITTLYAALGPHADRLKTYFISVDAETDTPEILALYLQSFDPRIVGLTGTEAELEQARRSFLAFAEKTEGAGGASWSHTSLIYLMDAAGRFVGPLDLSQGVSIALKQLQFVLPGVKLI